MARDISVLVTCQFYSGNASWKSWSRAAYFKERKDKSGSSAGIRLDDKVLVKVYPYSTISNY